MMKLLKKAGCLLLIPLIVAGCTQPLPEDPPAPDPPASVPAKTPGYEVTPETFALDLLDGDAVYAASLPGGERRVQDYVRDASGTGWIYPDEQMEVRIEPADGYLSVSIRSTSAEDTAFSWPTVSGGSYYLPMGEGKLIPSNDSAWTAYLGGESLSVLEQLSMPFWASSAGDKAVLFIMESPFRSSLDFPAGGPLSFSLGHEYPAIDPEKENRLRIYLVENDPVAIAKTYRQYVIESGWFHTLAQKAGDNPNIEKLYGAPHIYFWEDRLILPDDINWPAFRQALSGSAMSHVKARLAQAEDGSEAAAVLDALAGQDYADSYQKKVLCRALSDALASEGFYDASAFPIRDGEMDRLLEKGVGALNGRELIALNKHALAANAVGAFAPVEQWAVQATASVVEEIKKAGIDRAWIGLNDWRQAYAVPKLVETAVEQGFLIGPYDSYHSIHEPGNVQWLTAGFEDASLYESATVTNQQGEKLSGFQGVGRKLNPTLSMPAVRQRVDSILSTGIPFNSWFIDCDATGEIYDDYTPGRNTTQQQDLAVRLERMAYIRDEGGMVIGSEGGNDFAAPTIAFAHGIELQSFSWMDPDMNKNADSEYYIGRYYNPDGGVPERFSKPVPIKEEYRRIFLDPAYQIPLYKLVYNDSVISTYHWDWSTFKIQGEVRDRMLREVLYNVPPLYHLDAAEWEKYGDAIAAHTKTWSNFSRQAIQLEMTDFERLSDDGRIQLARYGDSLSVIANFSEEETVRDGQSIPPHSLLILRDGKAEAYTPSPTMP